MVLLIAYDLHKPDRDYEAVIATIKSFGSWAHDEESVWFVDTTNSPAECRDTLSSVASEATYFVIQVRQNWASKMLSTEVMDWLKSRERSW